MGRWRPACADGVGGLVPSLVAHLVEPFVGLVCGLETSARGKRCCLWKSSLLVQRGCESSPARPRLSQPAHSAHPPKQSPRSSTVPFCLLLLPSAAARPSSHLPNLKLLFVHTNHQTLTESLSAPLFPICKKFSAVERDHMVYQSKPGPLGEKGVSLLVTLG